MTSAIIMSITRPAVIFWGEKTLLCHGRVSIFNGQLMPLPLTYKASLSHSAVVLHSVTQCPTVQQCYIVSHRVTHYVTQCYKVSHSIQESHHMIMRLTLQYNGSASAVTQTFNGHCEASQSHHGAIVCHWGGTMVPATEVALQHDNCHWSGTTIVVGKTATVWQPWSSDSHRWTITHLHRWTITHLLVWYTSDKEPTLYGFEFSTLNWEGMVAV